MKVLLREDVSTLSKLIRRTSEDKDLAKFMSKFRTDFEICEWLLLLFEPANATHAIGVPDELFNKFLTLKDEYANFKTR